MATSRQTPRVWSDAIRGSEILANWFKLGANAVVLWLSIGMILGGALRAFWFLEGTTPLDRRLWLHHVCNGLGIGARSPICAIRSAVESGFWCPRQTCIATQRSFETVSIRLQESLYLSFVPAVAGTVIAAYFLRQSGRSATEDRHIRGTTMRSRHPLRPER